MHICASFPISFPFPFVGRYNYLVIVLILASFGKLFYMLTAVWTYPAYFPYIVAAFVLTSNIVAVTAFTEYALPASPQVCCGVALINGTHTHTLLISHSQVHHCMGGRCIGRRLRGASPVSSCALVVGISQKQRASAVAVTTTKYPLVCHDTMVVVELLHAFHALQGAL